MKQAESDRNLIHLPNRWLGKHKIGKGRFCDQTRILGKQ